jgi:tRNA G10  N-methylase Trm11
MKSLCILGRQPAISLAELESRYGAGAVTPIKQDIALVDRQPDISQLGGTQKIARLYAVTTQKSWKDIEHYLKETLPTQLADMPDKKLHLGISVYGINVSLGQLQKTTFALKRTLKQHGHSIRIVPNKSLALSSAQVLHNHFTDDNGAEIVLAQGKDGQLYIGKTTAVQDIDSYTARDQKRPKRDAKVGMLPPKLAQIIINLAERREQKQVKGSAYEQAPISLTVLDPFCGTGVILQEALLMGFTAYGSDIEKRMIEYTEANLAWLAHSLDLKNLKYTTVTADATTHEWELPFDTIACEAYLGRPFSASPDEKTLNKVMQDVDTIHRKFLKNVARQTEPGFRMCIAVPCWIINEKKHHLKTLDKLEGLGYTRQSFVHAENQDLIYHREGQIVGRELLVLTRNYKS